MKAQIIFTLFFLLAGSLLYAQTDTNSITSNIDVQPQIISKPVLQFPEMAQKAGLQASIYVKILVDKDGKPRKTEILKRDPEFVYLFDNIVRKWAMKVVFSPAMVNNRPVPVYVIIPVNFKLEDFQPPEVKKEPQPEYPGEALEMGLEGWVALAVLVRPDGSAEGTVKVVSREPASTDVFDKAAIEVAKNTTFQFAFTKGLPSYGWKFLKVEFHLPSK